MWNALTLDFRIWRSEIEFIPEQDSSLLTQVCERLFTKLEDQFAAYLGFN